MRAVILSRPCSTAIGIVLDGYCGVLSLGAGSGGGGVCCPAAGPAAMPPASRTKPTERSKRVTGSFGRRRCGSRGRQVGSIALVFLGLAAGGTEKRLADQIHQVDRQSVV